MRSNKPGLLLLILFIITQCVLPVQAVPPLPAEYYGNVLIDGAPAPVGTTITAFIRNIPKGSIVTDIDGFYGGPGLFDPRLKVNLTEEEVQAGDLIITFQINGIPASQSVLFEPGAAQQLDLFTGEPTGEMSAPVMTPIPVQTEPTMETPQTGDNYSEPPESDSGSEPAIQYGLENDEKFTSDDGMAAIAFNKNTLLFAPSGQFLEEVNVSSRTIADLAPISTNRSLMFSGYAYEITPERTYFNPEGVFSIQIPLQRISDLMALNPQIYRYVPQTASWEQVRTTSNQFTGVVSATVYEAAIYALFLESKNAYATPQVTETTVPPTLAPIAGHPPVPQTPSYPPQGPVSQGPAPYSPAYQEPHTQVAMVTQVPEMPAVPSAPEPSPVEPVQTLVQENMPQPTETSQPMSEITEEPAAQVTGPSPFTFFGGLVDSVKTSLSGPVGLIFGLVLLIIIINALAYLIYTRWWLVRDP
ncbi:hypothetical protein [Methanospirillum hungatei]|uniref:hypothetical protein n=1 Tax=Methanospirillum hungatei TaxID=2203 RepID=UPI002BBCC91B|nr:hypothetical protein [Methanospirillum hungatei]HOW04369.1 hypothetical protein [Methanospirillum hungatei]